MLEEQREVPSLETCARMRGERLDFPRTRGYSFDNFHLTMTQQVSVEHRTITLKFDLSSADGRIDDISPVKERVARRIIDDLKNQLDGVFSRVGRLLTNQDPDLRFKKPYFPAEQPVMLVEIYVEKCASLDDAYADVSTILEHHRLNDDRSHFIARRRPESSGLDAVFGISERFRWTDKMMDEVEAMPREAEIAPSCPENAEIDTPADSSDKASAADAASNFLKTMFIARR